jgi:hypothetical protein
VGSRSRETVVSVAVTVAVGAAAYLVIGAPDPRGAVDFLTAAGANVATLSQAAAFSGMLCWTLLAVVACSVAVHAVRSHRSWPAGKESLRALTLAAVAAALLVAAVLRHNAADSLCCADPAAQMHEVVQLAG